MQRHWGGREGSDRVHLGQSHRAVHVGNGWWGAYSDAMGRVMTRCGWHVHRVLRQRHRRANTRPRREPPRPPSGRAVPEEGYQGEYVAELATAYDGPEELEAAGRWAAQRILDNIRTTLARLGMGLTSGTARPRSRRVVRYARPSSCSPARVSVEEEDGAVWFRSPRLGDNRDPRPNDVDGMPLIWPAISPITATSSSFATSTGVIYG